MGRTRVYIKPFVDDAGTGYVDSWVEVSQDIVSIGVLSHSLDLTEYDLGIFRAANLKLSLRNDRGLYSDVGAFESIFKYKRGESLVRVTWEPGDHDVVCGFFDAGQPNAILTDPLEVFEGLLNDDASKSDIDDIKVDFQIMGYESLLQKLVVPFADIANGELLSSIIYKFLNQAPFNQRVNVSALNISCATDVVIDDKTKLENKLVLDALKNSDGILALANSVLFIRNGSVYVKGRTATADLIYEFYGPGSQRGIENIVDIAGYRPGVNRLFNYVTWKDTTLLSQDLSSKEKYGAFKKEMSSDLITNNTRRTTIITAIKDEFGTAKREMELETWVDTERYALFLLDKVAIDYPAPIVPREQSNYAVFERDKYDERKYADELTTLTIESTARFKIISRRFDFIAEKITYGLREV